MYMFVLGKFIPLLLCCANLYWIMWPIWISILNQHINNSTISNAKIAQIWEQHMCIISTLLISAHAHCSKTGDINWFSTLLCVKLAHFFSCVCKYGKTYPRHDHVSRSDYTSKHHTYYYGHAWRIVHVLMQTLQTRNLFMSI